MSLVGIYKITNKINGNVYIGKSTNIHKRWVGHKYSYKKEKCKKYVLYKAFLKYGLNNFDFSILELCELKKLNELEKKYIKQYNSFIGFESCNGYNMTTGGDGGKLIQNGENNVNSKLTNDDVYLIREMYDGRYTKKETYELFKNKISINTFANIWTGTTWKHIFYSVYTTENKKIQRNNFSREKQISLIRTTTDECVVFIRDKKCDGLTNKQVYEMITPKMNRSTFNDIWYGKTFPNIISNKVNKNIKYRRIVYKK